MFCFDNHKPRVYLFLHSIHRYEISINQPQDAHNEKRNTYEHCDYYYLKELNKLDDNYIMWLIIIEARDTIAQFYETFLKTILPWL